MTYRLVVIVTVPVTANVLLRGQLRYLREHDFEVTVISSPGPDLHEVAIREGVRVIAIPMAREISAPADAISLARLVPTLRALRPHVVNASTTKAGLLGMLAATAVRVPRRIYQLRGLRLETEVGIKRSVLGVTERLAAGCAHHVWCNSASLRAAYLAAGFASPQKCAVIGPGSSNGVDVARFARTPERVREALAWRRQLGIADDALVIGFVGRPVADKGIRELIAAFDLVRAAAPATRLVVVGAGLAGDRATDDLAARDDIVLVPHVAEPAPFYAFMDVLAFPSRREGFPNVVLEAAAAGIPAVGVRSTGVVDAIVDGETGRLAPLDDSRALADALLAYVRDAELRRAHGERARARVVSSFARERVWEAWRRAYVELLP